MVDKAYSAKSTDVLYCLFTILFEEDTKRPLYQYLQQCAESGECILDESEVQVVSYDFKKRALQKNKDLKVYGEKLWGRGVKDILKYVYLRYFG